MAAPKRPTKPAEPVMQNIEEDDIPDPDVPQLSQGEDVNIKTATAASQMAQLDPQDMWQISVPAFTVYLERHFPCPNGRWEKEGYTIRAGSYEEYQYKRGLLELEWESRYEEIAMQAEEAASSPPAHQGTPQAHVPPPPATPRQAPAAQSGGEEAPYCHTHNTPFYRNEKDGQVWYSHQTHQKPGGNGWYYCRYRG